jgi:hypothetical protein
MPEAGFSGTTEQGLRQEKKHYFWHVHCFIGKLAQSDLTLGFTKVVFN